jgi:hypothetical protein
MLWVQAKYTLNRAMPIAGFTMSSIVQLRTLNMLGV